MNFSIKKALLTEKMDGLFQNSKKVVFGIMAGAALLFAATSCEKNPDSGNFDQSTSAGALANLSCTDTVSIPVDANGIVTVSTLTNDKLWKLNGVSYVDDGQTLTIQAGTTIITGDLKSYNDPQYGPQSLAGVLVVARGGKLIADGTAAAPIIFTSASAGGCGTGCSNAGDFGGIVILGKATTNRATPVRIEGIPQPAGTDITYGGPLNNSDNDDSGILRYVRIEFPGYQLDADNEINGLTLGGVGTGTVLSHIQVSYSADDAFEFFGGTVNADHLVAIGTDDDDFDFDFGYTGTIEYAIGLKDPNSTSSGTIGNSDSNGIESDNDGTGTGATPFTKPTLRHFTLLGYENSTTGVGKLRSGNRWRRASSLDIQYSIIAGFPTGVEFDNITNPANFSNNVVHAYNTLFNPATPPTSVNSPLFTDLGTSPANDYLELNPAPSGNPFFSCTTAISYNAGFLIPRLGSDAYGDGSTTYKGAFQPGVAPWTATWTNFAPGFCCN